MICSVNVQLPFTDFFKVAHVGSNQQLSCVYIPWHKPIILTELSQGQHVNVYVYKCNAVVATYL